MRPLPTRDPGAPAHMDPVNPQSFNRYAYVLNNPLRWVDPSGHQAQSPEPPLRFRDSTTVTATASDCFVLCRDEEDLFLLGINQRQAIKLRSPRNESLGRYYLEGTAYLLELASFYPGVGSLKLIGTGARSLLTFVTAKKAGQLAARGWSKLAINEVVNNPFTTRASTNLATGNSATAYYRADGHYLIRDNITGQLVQASDTAKAVGIGPGLWRPDVNIVNPFFPK